MVDRGVYGTSWGWLVYGKNALGYRLSTFSSIVSSVWYHPGLPWGKRPGVREDSIETEEKVGMTATSACFEAWSKERKQWGAPCEGTPQKMKVSVCDFVYCLVCVLCVMALVSTCVGSLACAQRNPSSSICWTRYKPERGPLVKSRKSMVSGTWASEAKASPSLGAHLARGCLSCQRLF